MLLGIAAAYWPTLSNGFIWDDDAYVENNRTLRSPAGLVQIWTEPRSIPQYYPLVHTTFWLEYQRWGLNPRGYHAVNLALHGVATLLVWRLLARLGVPGAWLGAALFGVHPVGVESVAWITERKNVLSLPLALGSILAYLRFSPPELSWSNVARRSPDQWMWYAVALALYVAALLSKTVTASVPAVLLVIFWWKRGVAGGWWRESIRLLPFFAIGLPLALTTAWFEKTHVGAHGAEWDFTPVDRVLIAGRALWFYAGKLLWPHPLAFFYERWEIDSRAWWQYLYPAAAVTTIVGLWLGRHRIGRGPLAAVLIFAGVLTPALGFFDVYPFRYAFVADHFQYHASVALVALIAAGLTLSWRARANWPAWTAPVAASVLLLLLATITWRQTHVYHDLIALYEHTLAASPRAWAAHQNLGYQLELQGRHREAIEHYRKAIAIYPQDARLHNSLGSALFAVGQFDEAERVLHAGLDRKPGDFDRADTLCYLGNILIRRGRLDEAIKNYQAVLQLRPRHADAHFNYGVALLKQEKWAAAEEKLRQAVELNPNYVAALQGWSAALEALGRTADAVKPLQRAAELDPKNGQLFWALGRLLGALGEWKVAEAHLLQATRLLPPQAALLYELGNVRLARGDRTGARAAFERALAVDPRHSGALAALNRLAADQSGR